jgi:hypothetical protein
MLGLDDVLGLEITEQQALLVQIPERRENLEHVGDRLRERERVGLA